MAEKKKLTWLLLLQGWAMLWVVIGHAPLTASVGNSGIDALFHEAAEGLMRVAYSFHMPLFIMISGYLFYLTRIVKPYAYKNMVTDKLKRLGIPYICFTLFAIIVKICLPGGVNRAFEMSFESVVSSFLYPFDGALQEMWFIAVILLYFLCRGVFCWTLRHRWASVAALAILVACNFIPVGAMTGFLAINRAVHFAIYFYIGLLIARYGWDGVLRKKAFVTVCCLAYVAAWKSDIELFQALSGCFAFWGIAFWVDSRLSHTLFSSFRNYTYQIYLMGIFAQIAVKFAYKVVAFPGSYLLFWAVCVLAGLYIPVLVSKTVQRIGNKVLKLAVGL